MVLDRNARMEVMRMRGMVNCPANMRYKRLIQNPLQSAQENGLGMDTLYFNNLDNPFSIDCITPEQSMMKQMIIWMYNKFNIILTISLLLYFLSYGCWSIWWLERHRTSLLSSPYSPLPHTL